jgi:hypothetical protein
MEKTIRKRVYVFSRHSVVVQAEGLAQLLEDEEKWLDLRVSGE